jgi:aerobic-type carbon monoxide dehydrogenase small subunit (CoxS/CutS family)
MEKRTITFTINDESVSLEVEPRWTLLRVIRDELRLTGTKEGCGEGDCGTCTVLVDGKAVNSCLILAVDADGKTITTIEGLAQGSELHPLQKAFIEKGAVQCGFCTPGMILSAKALLDGNPHPSEEEIRSAISGNLCRCTGYVKVVEAIQSVSEMSPRKVR